jgi:hypothetical protein
MDTVALLEVRQAKDHFFATADESPLGHEHRHDFDGLSYYGPNPDLVFRLPVEEGDQAEVKVGTSDGAERTYRRAGRVRFEVNGESVSLSLFSTGHPGWFLPFRDSTSGRETYGAGRCRQSWEPRRVRVCTLFADVFLSPTEVPISGGCAECA